MKSKKFAGPTSDFTFLIPAFFCVITILTLYPGLTDLDSQIRWRTAQWFAQWPWRISIGDWFSPLLIIIRVWAIKLGLGYGGYHLLFCILTFGTWTVLVSVLFRKKWQRLVAHLLLFIPFLGMNLAFQAADVFLAVGLAWIIIGMRLGTENSVRRWHKVMIPLAFGGGALLALGARHNANLILPLLLVIPFFLWKPGMRSVACSSCVAILGAKIIILSVLSAWEPHIKQEYKAETFMTFEIIGVWKFASAKVPDESPPALFALLPESAEYYTNRWRSSDGDELFWRTPSLRNRDLVIIPNADAIRRDYFNTIRRFPLAFTRMKLSFLANGMGLSRPFGEYLYRPPPDEWLDQIKLDMYPDPILPVIAQPFLEGTHSLLGHLKWLAAPWIWWSLYLGLLVLRLLQRRVQVFDLGFVLLVATYHCTILLFAASWVPRYAFVIWMLLPLGALDLSFRTAASSSAEKPSPNAR
jgi:hypothetical protein